MSLHYKSQRQTDFKQRVSKAMRQLKMSDEMMDYYWTHLYQKEDDSFGSR